ncbi:MAG: alpha-amylase family glycosyl hydrolase [Bacteroidota bacterium]
MKKNMALIIVFGLIIGISNESKSQAYPGVEIDPVQYGKPFANVPDRRDVTLYQVNIRTFGKDGDFKGVSDRLDSIKALGANVIYLMPIYPIGKVLSVNSPYCIKGYKAVNPEFGTLDDLRAIVDSAHSKNMAVLLDWVPNHTSYDHNWTQNKSWYLQDSTGNIISPPGTGWNDVAQLNYSNSDMRLAMIHAMKYWVLTANIDGFRCDYSDGPPVDFWKQAIDTLRNITSHKLLLLAEGTRSENFEVGFDYNFGFRFFEVLKKIYEHNYSVRAIDSLNIADNKKASDGQQFIRYITNHDVNGSDGTPLQLFGGEKGSMAAFIIAAYMNSVPMIYTGQEVGTPDRMVFPFTSKKIDWNINPGITAEYKKVIAFRNKSEAIRRGNLTSYTNDDVCAFTKKSGSEEVLVLINLRNKSVDYKLSPLLQDSSWKNMMTNKKTALKKKLVLQPYSYLILKN